MKHKKLIFVVCIALLLLMGCAWSRKTTEKERLPERQQPQTQGVQGDYDDILINKETTTEAMESSEPVTDAIKTEDNSFSDVEYGKYSSVSSKLTDFVFEKDGFTLCFEANYQALVSYDEKQGRLQIHLPGCRSVDFNLPQFYKNDYFSELVIAASEEGIDVLAYLNKKWCNRVTFEFEEAEYNMFKTDIIVP